MEELESMREKLTRLEALIDDQKHGVMELQHTKEVLEMIINNIPNQIFCKSRDLVYMGCNKAFAQVTGMGRPSEVIGKSDYDFHRDSTHADSYRDWDKRIMDENKAVVDIEELFHNSDGSEGTVLTSKVPLRGEDGKVFGILGICTDISQRKQMEIENELLINDLKAAISEVKALSGLLPICSNCKKIRDTEGYWQQVEKYIQDHSEVEFSHGICDDCKKELYPDLDT